MKRRPVRTSRSSAELASALRLVLARLDSLEAASAAHARELDLQLRRIADLQLQVDRLAASRRRPAR